MFPTTPFSFNIKLPRVNTDSVIMVSNYFCLSKNLITRVSNVFRVSNTRVLHSVFTYVLKLSIKS